MAPSLGASESLGSTKQCAALGWTSQPLTGLTWFLFPGSPQVELPPYLERVKQQANEAFACQQWTQAIQLYSKAVQKAPHNAMLYGNRAAAYMKRKW